MSKTIIISLIISLTLTLFLETGFYLIVYIKKYNLKDLLLVVLVNIITNPVVVLTYWLMTRYTGFNPVIVIIPLEISAVLTEGYYYKRYGQFFKKPFLFSLAANGFSYATGLFIQFI
ncbi:MAG: hypothetical protein FWG44_05335 [Oscillospiraceae bacterium]|nr:hypothetical protein [Oscillospiraceae bacterium]